MKCRLCNRDGRALFCAQVLDRYSVWFYYCEQCGFLETEDPFWLEESYTAPINLEDTGILQRNIHLADVCSAILPLFMGKSARCVDFAGGYGILTRLLRDRGIDCFWHDKYADNLFARGFEFALDNKGMSAITCFEALEHFPEPQKVIDEMLSISSNLLFTTELLPDPPPSPGSWWYYGFEHGQHVSFYSLRTLKYIAATKGLNLYSNGVNTHLLTKKKIPPILFSFLVRLAPYGLGKIPSLFLKSKTFQDMRYLSGRARRGHSSG
jgi:hypothetical protein